MGFFRAVLWELVQNLPLIVAFVVTVWLWSRDHKAKAILCLVAGSVASSLLIRFTEPIIHGYYETLETTLVNIVSLSLLMAVFSIYLGSNSKWNNWKTDLLLGGLAGTFLAVAQGLASPGDPLIAIVVHSLALALAAPVALASIRTLKAKPLMGALNGALVITFMVTIVISLVDYGYFLIGLD